jgi:hypothetical protein
MRALHLTPIRFPAGLLVVLGAACGDAGPASVPGHNPIAAPDDNVARVDVDFGLPNIGYVDGLFAAVTLCVPGTSDCQTVEHMLVDTGSSGLRVLGSALTLALPEVTNARGTALAECGQFVGGFMWGPLRTADFAIAGQRVNQMVLQVIDESSFPVPGDCTGVSGDTAESLGANGILGVGSSLQDCGTACTLALGPRSGNPGIYYACTSPATGGCQAAAVPADQQLTNPVALFSQDNNGTIIELPAISSDGAPQVAGALVFGIETRENNRLGKAKVLPLDSRGIFATRYPVDGSPTPAFLDSGSNAIYFLDSVTTKIPVCADPYPYFYCPSSTMKLSAENQDLAGTASVTVDFSIANAIALFRHVDNFAFANLGGPSSDPQSGNASVGTYFDWGLPFYFGRNVFTAIEGQATAVGPGPFVAF